MICVTLVAGHNIHQNVNRCAGLPFVLTQTQKYTHSHSHKMLIFSSWLRIFYMERLKEDAIVSLAFRWSYTPRHYFNHRKYFRFDKFHPSEILMTNKNEAVFVSIILQTIQRDI